MTARELLEILESCADAGEVLVYNETGVWKLGDAIPWGDRIDLLVGEQLSFRAPIHVHIHRLLRGLDRKVDQIMANLDALNAAVDTLVTADSAAAAELDALAAEVATLEAGAISQAQIDTVTQRVTDVATSLAAATEAAKGPAPAAPAGDPGAPPPAGAPPADAPPPGDTPPPPPA